MQFRAKFGLSGWLPVATATVYLVAWLFRRNHPWDLYFALTWATAVLLYALKVRFFYWEMDSACLRLRWLWGKTEIPWQSVTSVEETEPMKSLNGRLIIYYKDPDPMTYRTSVVVNAQDRPAFLDALRGFAPQAKLEA